MVKALQGKPLPNMKVRGCCLILTHSGAGRAPRTLHGHTDHLKASTQNLFGKSNRLHLPAWTLHSAVSNLGGGQRWHQLLVPEQHRHLERCACGSTISGLTTVLSLAAASLATGSAASGTALATAGVASVTAGAASVTAGAASGTGGATATGAALGGAAALELTGGGG